MMEYPVTHGYTINIVKDKTKPAIILLTPSMNNPNVKIIRPSSSSSNISVEKTNVPDSLDEDQSRSKTLKDVAVPEHVTNKVELNPLPSDQVVFYEDVVTDNNEHVGYFADVAHEEVVTDSDVQPSPSSVETKITSKKKKDSETSVQCDICNTLLPSRDSAREHMKVAHDMMSYEG